MFLTSLNQKTHKNTLEKSFWHYMGYIIHSDSSSKKVFIDCGIQNLLFFDFSNTLTIQPSRGQPLQLWLKGKTLKVVDSHDLKFFKYAHDAESYIQNVVTTQQSNYELFWELLHTRFAITNFFKKLDYPFYGSFKRSYSTFLNISRFYIQYATGQKVFKKKLNLYRMLFYYYLFLNIFFKGHLNFSKNL